MTNEGFNNSIKDSQGTNIIPVKVKDFDMEKYQEYENGLLKSNKDFMNKDQGVLVYRRFRVPEVFLDGCKDMELSLSMQLGALQESMKYKGDIANFLEPWYGIGTVASSFGLDYIWNPGQAPATKAAFKSLEEALEYKSIPVEQTPIGKSTLQMIEYFLEKTQGKLPISLCDTQSPLNISGNLIELSDLFLEMYDDPEKYEILLSRITDLSIEFTRKQLTLIGDALASPGHGFASSRAFSGIGMSDDTMIMMSNEMYNNHLVKYMERVAESFNGLAFHSCGNWSRKVSLVKNIQGVVTVDGAFSDETDPSPNDIEPFRQEFSNTGIVINARIVGDAKKITETVKRLWTPGMKLIVVTYCKSPEEQEIAYNNIHDICGC